MTQRYFIHITDLHIFPQTHIPRSRIPELAYRQMWDELHTLRDDILSLEPKPLCIVISGDIFHFKNPRLYSPLDIMNVISYFESFPLPILVTPGNHDLPDSSMDRYDSSVFRLLTHSASNIHLLSPFEPFVIKPFSFYGIPYAPLYDTVRTLRSLKPSDTQKYGVCLLHSDFVPDSEVKLPFPVLSQYQLPYINPYFTHFCLGHIHLSFPPLTLSPLYVKDFPELPPPSEYPYPLYHISKPWSVGRTQNDYFNRLDFHQPSYALVSEKTLEYRTLSSFLPSTELFRETSLRKEAEHSEAVREFVSSLSIADLAPLRNESQDPFQTLSLEPRIHSIIQEYIHKAEELLKP